MEGSRPSDASSSVDGQSPKRDANQSQYEGNHRVTFPMAWRHHLDSRHDAEKFKKSLEHFYRLLNGMQVMVDEICKRLIIPTPIPEHLFISDIEDRKYDKTAAERGRDILFTPVQNEGLKNKDWDTINGLLLQAMAECKDKKMEAISKCEDIRKMKERCDERLAKRGIRDNKLSPCEPLHMFEAEKEVQEYLQNLDNDKLQRYIEYLYVDGRIQEYKRNEEREEHERKQKLLEEDMQKSVSKLEDKHSAELRKYEEEKNRLDLSYTTISQRNLENSNEKQKLQRDLDKVKKDKDEKIKQIEKQWKDEKIKVNNLMRQLKKFEKEKQSADKELKEFAQKDIETQRDRARLSLKVTNLEESIQKLINSNKNFESELANVKTQLVHQIQSNADKGNTIGQMKYDLEKKEQEIHDLKKNKEVLLTRLSKVAGAKLTHENANITDLSDPNRPTKIAEKFSELYDNEWTDALEELVAANVNEKTSILFLRDTVMKSFRLCSETARKQTFESRRCFKELPLPDSEDLKICSEFSDCKLSLDETVIKDIDRIRKELAPSTANLVQQRFSVIMGEYLRNLFESKKATTTESQAVKESNLGNQPDEQSSSESMPSMQLPLSVSTKPGSLSRSLSSPSSEEAKPVVNPSKSMYSKLPPTEIIVMANLADFSKGVYIKKDNDADDKKDSQNMKEESKREGELHDQEELEHLQEEDSQKEKMVRHDQTAKDSNETYDTSSLPCSSDQNDVLPEEQRIEQNNPISDLQQKDKNPEGSEITAEGKQSELAMHSSMDNIARIMNRKDQVTGNIPTDSATAADGQAGEDISKLTDKESAKQDLPNPDQLNTPSPQILQTRFQKVFNYSRKCVSLCWFMRSHSPELYLEDKAERDSKLDAERFKQYTKTGHTLDYVVWPALFLYEGGPLLGKGVAQPK